MRITAPQETFGDWIHEPVRTGPGVHAAHERWRIAPRSQEPDRPLEVADAAELPERARDGRRAHHRRQRFIRCPGIVAPLEYRRGGKPSGSHRATDAEPPQQILDAGSLAGDERAPLPPSRPRREALDAAKGARAPDVEFAQRCQPAPRRFEAFVDLGEGIENA